MGHEDRDTLIQELFLLQRAAQRINATLDLDILLDAIVNDVAETFGCSRSGILLKDSATNELVIAAVRGWTVNYHTKGDRFRIGEYGMVGHVGETGETYYAPDVRVDPYYQVSEEQTLSEVDIPLKVHGELIGVFNAQHNAVDAFSPDRIRVLEALAGHIAVAIENARLFERERREKERMRKDADEARRIQQDLFPVPIAGPGNLTVEGLCSPCWEVGGDWFDYIPLPGGRLGVVLGDVSGKGMGAALLMSSTRSILRLVAGTGASPGDVLARVNELLLNDLPAAKFVTLVYAVLADDGEIVFANAGHPPPCLAGRGRVDPLHSDEGLPLGIRRGAFSERTVRLASGERLVLYSDGVTEAMDQGMEQYGEARLLRHLRTPTAGARTLLDDVRRFTGSHPVSDDITVLAIRAS